MAAADQNAVDYGGCIFYDENSGSVVNMPERPSAEKKTRNLPAEDETAIRLLIHFKHAGAVIGSGGSNIERLRNTFQGLTVNVSGNETPERVLTIGGHDLDMIFRCLEEVLMIIHPNSMEKTDCSLKMLVQGSQAGAIIGRGGQNIAELRKTIPNCEVKVYSDRCPYSTERVVQIDGTGTAIIECSRRILNLCLDNPPNSKQKTALYDPNYWDPMYADAYGGFIDPSWKPRGGGGGGGGFRHAPPPQSGGYYGGGYGRDYYGGSQGGGYGYYGGGGGGGGEPSIFGEGDIFQNYAYSSGASMPLGGGGGGGEDDFFATDQVTVPNELAGIIIGKSGDNIRTIRGQSGASIAVSSEEIKQGERVITITGMPEQIRIAKDMMQHCVKQSSTGRKYLRDTLGFRF